MISRTLPAADLSREAVANREVGQTTISRGVAAALTGFFLVAIFGVLALEVIAARRSAESTVWSKLASIPREFARATGQNTGGVLSEVFAGNRAVLAGLAGFERTLEDESLLGRTLRPPAQLVLSRWLGAGNERVYIGRQDARGIRWVFYRPDVEYVTGRGFLEEEIFQRRIAAASEWTAAPHPDPRPAILAFRRLLQSRGITLILMPTPVKPSIHPEQLAGAYRGRDGIVQNASYEEFVASLRSQQVLVFEAADVLGSARRSSAQYLATDTHWRPEAVELVAERLAAFVQQHTRLPDVPGPELRIEEVERQNVGDTAVMLDLPEHQQLYPPERVLISRVVTPEGPWRSDRDADVLVLGDSFSNIYSLESMGWGGAAGLVEHLSYALRRPIDRIVQNDDGAFATREILHRSGPERLTGKRVVIWQFAARELAAGNWKVIE